MKTVNINGKEIAPIPMTINPDPFVLMQKLEELILALDGLSFEKKEEQKPFSVENPPEDEQPCWYIELINGSPYVYSSFFIKGSHIASKLLSTSNCYRTEEEAEAALKRVLQALKS